MMLLLEWLKDSFLEGSGQRNSFTSAYDSKLIRIQPFLTGYSA
jgi:hypothetical protein